MKMVATTKRAEPERLHIYGNLGLSDRLLTAPCVYFSACSIKKPVGICKWCAHYKDSLGQLRCTGHSPVLHFNFITCEPPTFQTAQSCDRRNRRNRRLQGHRSAQRTAAGGLRSARRDDASCL